MLDASLIVLIGFILFISVALRFGYRKSINALDQKISEVKETLVSAEQKKAAAEEEFKKQKQAQRNIKQDIEELTIQTKAQIAEINAHAQDEIERLFANRQNNFELQIERIRNSTIELLNTTITDMAVTTLTQLLKSLPEASHETINDQQLDEFERIIGASTTDSNGGQKKTIKKTVAA